MQLLQHDEFESPIGLISVYAIDGALCHLDFNDCEERINRLLTKRFIQYRATTEKQLLNMQERLAEYFNQHWNVFDDLQLDSGGSDFQKKVWGKLQTIPRGETWSYLQLAKSIGQPTSSRAVASANARNPVAIIVPCHRVIASNGALAGFAGGIARKKWLLEHEQALTE